MPMETLTIARRFNGPPRSGNGGYVAGILAQRLGRAATVRLNAPLPLDHPLALQPTADGCALYDGDTLLAQARPGGPDLEAPPAPAPDEARRAVDRFPGEGDHTFPHCFVCGPARAPGDGLRVFAGHLADGERVAALWTPSEGLADSDGHLRAEYIWAALDCPGAFAIGFTPGQALLLGEMTAELRSAVPAAATYSVLGWVERIDGRKHYTGTALYDTAGRCLALARGTWFAVPAERIA